MTFPYNQKLVLNILELILQKKPKRKRKKDTFLDNKLLWLVVMNMKDRSLERVNWPKLQEVWLLEWHNILAGKQLILFHHIDKNIRRHKN